MIEIHQWMEKNTLFNILKLKQVDCIEPPIHLKGGEEQLKAKLRYDLSICLKEVPTEEHIRLIRKHINQIALIFSEGPYYQCDLTHVHPTIREHGSGDHSTEHENEQSTAQTF